MKRFVMAFLCLCLSLVAFTQRELPTVHFNFGQITFDENVFEASTRSDFDFSDAYDDRVHRWVVFEKLPSHTQRQAIESEGFKFLEYIRSNCYLMTIPTNANISSLHGLGARSIQKMMRESKINLRIIDGDIPDGNQVAGGVTIKMLLFDEVDANRLMTRLEAYKVTHAQQAQYGNFIVATAPLDQIDHIAQLSEIRFIDLLSPKGEPESVEGSSMQRGNVLNNQLTGGLRLDGSGVAVLVNDDGFVGPHIDFAGRLTNEAGINTSPFRNHADGVAGCMGAAGNGDPTVVSPASGAEIFVKEYQSDFNDNTLNYHLNNNVMVTNTSYSNGCNAGYTAVTRLMDEMVYNNPSLTHVFSAGNSGASNCGYGAGAGWGNITGGHKIGKNVVAVANLDANIQLESSSSRGPANDGRIKPDLAAHGQGQRSNLFGHRYRNFGGTSAAAPTAASTFAQLYQAYRQDNSGQNPKSSLIKAVMMNSAQDLGNPGPDFKFGYGLVDAGRAYETLDQNWYATATKNEGQFYGRYLFVPQNVVECRVMLYWSDPPGSVNASQALVNDLDLVVRDGFAGDAQLPFVLNTTPNADSLNLPASNGEDHLNNMEQVVAAPPTSGFLWIEVGETALPMGPQEFHLVWTFVYDEIEVTYPLGNEKISTNESERIHWNAFGDNGTFDVALSTDNGGSWTTLASNLPGDQRSLTWVPTNIASSECLIRVSRNGQSGQSTETFDVFNRPDVLCVDQGSNASEALISWDPVPGAFAYRMYRFDGTTMVPFAETIMTEFTVENIVANQDYHFAVAAFYSNGESQRSNAYFYRSDDEGTCPSCDVPLTVPYAESFESGFGTHCNPTCGDDFDWLIGSGGTSTSQTGPSAAFDGTSYALIESSAPNQYLIDANLESPCIQLPAQAEMSFAYHMYGSSMGGLVLWISTDDGVTWNEIWSRFGNQGNQWNQQTIDLSAYGDQVIKYRFRCSVGSFRSDMAVDDIKIVTTQACVNQFPWSESFDSYATCTPNSGAQTCDIGGGWVQTTNGAGDDNDWRINSGATNSVSTGPQSDRSGSGNYAYVESSIPYGLTNILTTPCFDVSSLTKAEFSFYYHRYGANMGPLYVEVSDDDGSTWNLAWSVTGQQQTSSADPWLQAVIDLSGYNGTIAVRFRGVGGTNWFSDMAIDDIWLGESTNCLATFPLSDDFNSYTNCSTANGAQACDFGGDTWTQVQNGSGDDNDWRVWSGSTPSSATGPADDVTGGGKYLYIESSFPYGLVSELRTQCLNLSAMLQPELTFSYHMYGSATGTLMVDISVDGGSVWINLFARTGQQQTSSGAAWIEQKINLSGYTGEALIRFRAQAGNLYQSDIAIDAISLAEAANSSQSGDVERVVLFEDDAIDQLQVVSTWTADDVAVFPNPTMDRFTAELPAFEGAMHWEIRNGQGRVVKQGETTSRSFDVDLSAYAAGHYIILLRDENTMTTKQLVKL